MKTLNRCLGRMLMTAMVAGLVAAAIGGVSLARAGSGDRTMTLTEVDTGAQFVNITNTPQGGPGDQIVLRRVVKNAAGDRVGTLNVVCEVVLGHKLLCNGVYRLPGGTITGIAQDVQSETSTAPVHVAITGGTGRYDKASGQITSTPTGPTTTQSVVDLD
jgi:hypothetical protein